MPTYEYSCKSCDERLEVQQRFTDDPLTQCPRCDGPLRKVFGNVGIAFKGSGFYKNDSRGASSKRESSTNGTSSSDTSSSDTSSSSSSADSSSGGSSSGSSGSTTASTAAAS